jgi:hypothetical protein
VKPQSCRFAHIDASHLYEHVSKDIDNVRELLVPEGVVALDDYRSPHTPGVAAAVWEAVLTKGLRPIVVSESKFYGTWGDARAIQAALVPWLAGQPQLRAEVDHVLGHTMLRVHG